MESVPDLPAIRAELPALAQVVHLNTGGAGPLPRAALVAIAEALATDSRMARMSDAGFALQTARRDRVRAALARMLHVAPEDLALTPTVTGAMNAVIHGIAWRAGDEVLTTSHEHPGLQAPLQAVAERSEIRIRVVHLTRGDEPLEDALTRLAGPSTRLIAISHVSWLTGATLDVAGAARVARRIGAPLLVDGAQAVGAFAVDPVALGADAYAINACKWTLGPQGLGALWIGPQGRRAIRPAIVGGGSGIPAAGAMTWHNDARRFEMGALPEPLLPGWAASLEWIQGLGLERIQTRTAQVVADARARLTALGAEILTPAGTLSGVVTFRIPGMDVERAAAGLEARGIVVRWTPEPRALRASFAFFTTEQDVDALVEGLSAQMV